jgi:hypothetical protein
LYFKVFGARVPVNTYTTVEAQPDSVEVSRTSSITVLVEDEDGNPCRGTVTLSATGGKFDSNSFVLNDLGTAHTRWTAPASTASPTITAEFAAGQGYNGLDYNPSSDDVTVSVDTFKGLRPTSTVLAFSKDPVYAKEDITVTATVTDEHDLPVTVNYGVVQFWASGGTFSRDVAAPSSGAATTQWTAPDTSGVYSIAAWYTGYVRAGATYQFRDSNDINDLTIRYRDFSTTTRLDISPTHPYVGKSTFVGAAVLDQSYNPVPGGIVRFSAPYGSFVSNDVSVNNGVAYTEWTAPSDDGDVTITATYAPDAPYAIAGKRYFSSTDSCDVHVTEDDDEDETDLSWMSQWISDYDDDPLKHAEDGVQGFTDKLTSLGWGQHEFSNTDARAKRMKGLPPWNEENKYMDKHDFTFYCGHGNSTRISFLKPWYDKYLDYTETVDSTGHGTWGDKDAEWLALASCQVLSSDYWLCGMDGLHLICGFQTKMQIGDDFGEAFANLLIIDSVYDHLPRTIVQSWFIMGDMTQTNDKAQRVIGGSKEVFSDYIWGQGAVASDPVMEGHLYASGYEAYHDVNNHAPVADAGGPYDVNVGEPVPLDGSGTTDVDDYDGATLYYRWDMRTTVNTDSKNRDYDELDEADDDEDCNGVSASYIYNTPGTYQIRLIVRDDMFYVSDAWSTVHVSQVPAPKTAGDISVAATKGGLEIVEDFNSVDLPTETQLPIFELAGTTSGFNDMLSVAAYFGITKDTAYRDSLGSWNFAEGKDGMVINERSGSVMYLNGSKAYTFSASDPVLPSDTQAKILADNFLSANGLLTADVNFVGVRSICAQTVPLPGPNNVDANLASSWHYKYGYFNAQSDPNDANFAPVTHYKHVNYKRMMDVNGRNYPVVGPGGKITVMLDGSWDVRMFIKIWRELSQTDNVPLIGAANAVQKFHELGQDALTKGSRLPVCERIEVDKVTLGYYEDSFSKLQELVPPVYVLDLTCDHGESSEKTRVYMSAMNEPLDANIISPNDDAIFDTNVPITFTGSVQGGTPPYSYEWSSDVEGVLSTSAGFTTSSLDTRRLSDPDSDELIPHTITFAVIDRKGFESKEFIQVTIKEGQCDFNDDSVTNFLDIAALFDAWLDTIGKGRYDDKLDLNNDEIINLEDLSYCAGEWH